MEIERKWMPQQTDWVDLGLPLLFTHSMRQGYVHADAPVVRIREEVKLPSAVTEYILCIKTAGTLTRAEIETQLSKEKFDELEALIGKPLITKQRRTYLLPDGLHLEVNRVDEGLPSEFWYAEIEYGSEEQARAWQPASAGLEEYLTGEVTEEPGQSMADYWIATRI